MPRYIPTYFSFMLNRIIKQKACLRDELTVDEQAQTNSEYDLPSINHPAYAALGACVLWKNYRQTTSSQTEEMFDNKRDASSKAKPQ